MRASYSGIMVTMMLTTFGQSLSASSIQEVRVLPTCTINPRDQVILEVLLYSGTTPTGLFEPTRVEIVDNQIAIDLFATSGNLLATSSLLVPIDLGTQRPGSYSFTIKLHGPGGPEVQEYIDTFEVVHRRCPDLPHDLRHLYWANDNGVIKRSSLNGSKIEGVIVDEHLSGFVLDANRKQIYWTSINDAFDETTRQATLQRANLDGSNRQVLLSLAPGSWPHQLIKSGRHLFWFEGWYAHSIWRSDIDGSNPHVILSGLNVAGNGGGKLIVNEGEGKIYWTELYDKIGRANLDGSESEPVLTGLYYPQLLAMDEESSRIYWSTYSSDIWENGLYSSNLDGTGITPVVVNPTIYPISALLGVVPGKIYWTNYAREGAIYRANLDGSEFEEVLGHLPDYPAELTFDRRSRKLFWAHPSMHSDRMSGFLMYANLNGTEAAVITDGVGWAFGLAIDRSHPKFPVRATGKP